MSATRAEAIPSTITHQPHEPPQGGGGSSSGSVATVAVVEGKQKFGDENVALLRRRLYACALILTVGKLAGDIHSVLHPTPFLIPRVLVTLMFLGTFLLLRSSVKLSIWALRAMEVSMFGTLLVLGTLVNSLLMVSFAKSGTVDSLMLLKAFTTDGIACAILMYALLIPSTWRRAALILTPVACLPYVNLWVLEKYSEPIAKAFAAEKFDIPIPLPFVALFSAVYGTHVIHSIRREAFRARQLGQYQLKEKLGAGGMGEVYRAEHHLLKRPCAIKLIHPELENQDRVLKRFEREVQATAQLSHWNVVDIYDYGHTPSGTFYYVMELLPGMALDALLRSEGRLPPARAIHFLQQMCAGLQEAHSRGMVHRDLKPPNVFIAKRGGLFDVVKLLDFGLVKANSDEEKPDETLTQEGVVSGTPLYMSPEQARSSADIDARADIYSLGCVGYAMLAGRPPFIRMSAIEVLMAHFNDPPEPLIETGTGIPADLETIIFRCLQKRPEDRFQTVSQMEHALNQCADANQWTQTDAVAWWSRNPQNSLVTPGNVEKVPSTQIRS